jgi:excisionase family DNA binding protein
MRLEEWFRRLETFDHTTRTSELLETEEGSAQLNRNEVSSRLAPSGASRFVEAQKDSRRFRSAPAPSAGALEASGSVCAEVSEGFAESTSFPLQKESREQLLARLLDPVLTLEEAAQVLNVCPTTVRRYTNKGVLQHYRTSGNQRRFRLSHVLSFLGESGGSLEVGTLSEEPSGRNATRSVRDPRALSRAEVRR